MSVAYFVSVKAFPIDAEPEIDRCDGGVDLHLDGRDEPLRVEARQMRTFGYNERHALEVRVPPPPVAEDGPRPDELVLRFLPVGSLVIHAVHRLPPNDEWSVDRLRAHGAACWHTSLSWYGWVHDVVQAMVHRGLLRQTGLSSLGILRPGDGPAGEANELRDLFASEMEWRAWSSGNYVAIHDGGAAGLPAWSADCDDPIVLQTPSGDVTRLFNNYYGWRLRPGSDRDPVTALVEELEPIAYMISRRSLCASGLANVRAITSALVHDGSHGMSAMSLRRYVGLVRLWLAAGSEYLEASDKRSREVYVMASDDLALPRHEEGLLEGLRLVTDETRQLHAEAEERRDRRLSRIMVAFSLVLGVSLVIDIVLFVMGEQPTSLAPDHRMAIVAGSALLLAFVSGLLLRRRS